MRTPAPMLPPSHDKASALAICSYSFSLVDTIIEETWLDFFNPLNINQVFLSSVIAILCLVLGFSLYLRVNNKAVARSEKEVPSESSFSVYSKPAMIAGMFFSLQFVLESVLIILNYYLDIFSEISLLTNIIRLLTPVVGVLLIYFVIIPVLKVKHVQQTPLSLNN